MSKSSEKVIEVIEEYLAEGGLIWHKPYMAVAQANAASRCEYRGINAFVTALVAGMRGYASPYWAMILPQFSGHVIKHTYVARSFPDSGNLSLSAVVSDCRTAQCN